jgi:cytidylate kinase
VALPEDRAKVVASRLGLSARAAAAWVEKTERERFAFVTRAFRQDPTCPHHYDLVLNTSRLCVEEAADLVIETLRRLEGRGALAEYKHRPAAGQADEGVGGPASPALA